MTLLLLLNTSIADNQHRYVYASDHATATETAEVTITDAEVRTWWRAACALADRAPAPLRWFFYLYATSVLADALGAGDLAEELRALVRRLLGGA